MKLLFIQNEDGTQEVAEVAAIAETQTDVVAISEQPAPGAEAVAVEAAAEAPAAGGGWSFWLMIIAMIAVMYFFMWRPESKRRKQMENFRNNLKKGDKIITAGGIYGTIKEIQPTSLLIEVDSNVTLRVDKNMVVGDPGMNAPVQK
jgi:preprotein translocase subunit YajC